MFQLLRGNRLFPPQACQRKGRLAEIVEVFAGAHPAAEIPAGRFGRALATLVRMIEARALEDIALVATLSAEASETAINAGWISHDIHEMTRSARAISGAVEKLATAINAVAENSVESAGVADPRHGRGDRSDRATDEHARAECDD